MKRNELQMAFQLLRALYPRACQFSDRSVQLAWGETLREYCYEDFRDAAYALAKREAKPPSLSALVSQLEHQKALGEEAHLRILLQDIAAAMLFRKGLESLAREDPAYADVDAGAIIARPGFLYRMGQEIWGDHPPV